MNTRSIVTVIALILALAFAAAVIFKPQTEPAKPATSELASAPVANTQALERAHSPSFGPANAPVTIVEFFDPSCEACRAFYPYVKQILDAAEGEVRLVLRYTLFHQGSEEVARLLEAARLQDLYQPVLEAVLDAQPAWHDDPQVTAAYEAAEQAGLNLADAREVMNSSAIDAILNTDTQDTQTLGISATPTFFVNGRELTEFGPKALLELVKQEAVKARE